MHKAWKAGDVKKLIEFYHPDVVLIAEGQWAAYGKEGKFLVKFLNPNRHLSEIYKRLEEFLKTPVVFKINITITTPAADGEYIIQHGSFETNGKPPAKYRQIFKRADGKYLIYHDLFEVN